MRTQRISVCCACIAILCLVLLPLAVRADVIEQKPGTDAVGFNAIQYDSISDPDGDGLVWSTAADTDGLKEDVLAAPAGYAMSPPPHESIATYRLRFSQAGTYRFYYRSRNNGTPGHVGSDSFWRPTDFDTTPTLYTGIPNTGDYAWSFSTINYTVASEDIGDVLEFRIGSREANARLCSIVLSTDTALTTESLDALCTTVIDPKTGTDTLAFNAIEANRIDDPDSDGLTWTRTADTDALAGQSIVAPSSSATSVPPHESMATYLLRFQTAGTYKLYSRARNNGTPGNGGTDSYWRPSDFDTTPTLYAGTGTTGEYVWSQPGNYTVEEEDIGKVVQFQIGSRESLARICSFVLSTDTTLSSDELDDLCSPLSVENLSPMNVTTTTAILRGELVATHGEATQVSIYWGTSDGGTDPASWNTVENLGYTERGTFDAFIEGLTPGGTVHFRAFSSNTLETAWAPATGSFVVPTIISPPTISNEPPLTIFDTAARMAGCVDNIGAQYPYVRVYYGLSDGGTNAGAWDGSYDLGRCGEGVCSAIVDGLATDTLHFYRFYASNSAGGAWASSSTLFRTDTAYHHPRLLFTRDQLPDICNRRFTTHVQEWVRLVQAAASAASSSRPTDTPVTNPSDMRGYEYDIESMALTQMIDPSQPYWDDFENYFWTVIRWPEWYDGGGGIRAGYRADLEVDHILRALAMSYDWLYDRFTWEEREEIRTRLIDYMEIHANWYGALAKDTIPCDSMVQNHPFNAFGSLASVTYGVDGIPSDTFDEWDQLLHDRLTSVTMILTNWMGDGGNNEGPPYHTYGLIQIELWYEIMRSAGGFTDAQLLEASPWFWNTTLFNLYSIIPGDFDNYGGVTPIGDGPPYFYYSPLYIEALLAKRLGNPLSQWLATQLEANINTGSYRLYRYLWLDPSLPSRNPSTFPNWHWFIHHGYFMWRTSWENDATHFFLRSGPHYSGHCQPDCGQFTIHRDGIPYVVDLGYSTPKYTSEHNVLLVDGEGQVGEGMVWGNYDSAQGDWPANDDIWGEMLHVLSEGEDYKAPGLFFDVLANPAPMYTNSKLTQWHRETVGLGNLYLVRDTVATNASADLDLLVHAYVSTPNNDSWEFWDNSEVNPWTTLSSNQWSIDPRDATPQPPNLVVTDVSADSWTPTIEDTLFSPHNDELVYVETRLGSRLRRRRTGTAGTSLLAFGFTDETSHWTLASWSDAQCEGLHATLTTSSAKVVDILWPLNGTGCTSSDGWDVTGQMAGRHYGEGTADLHTGYFGRNVTAMCDDGLDLVTSTNPVSILAHMEHGPSAGRPLTATVYTDAATSLTLYTPHHPNTVLLEGASARFTYASDQLTLTVPACEATSLPLHIEIVDVQGAPTFARSPFDMLAATEDDAYSGSLIGRASDPDGDTLTFTKVSGPDWLQVSSTGVLSGTPDNADVGKILEFRIAPREPDARVDSIVMSPQTDLTDSALDALCTDAITQGPGEETIAFHAIDATISDPDGNGYVWTAVDDPDALAGQVLVAPSVYCMSPPPHESIATFHLRFRQAGTYRLYYRARNNGTPGDPNTDSIWRPSDFDTTPTLYAGTPTSGQYAWVMPAVDYTVDAEDVGEIIEFRIGSRERDARLCSIVLSMDQNLTTDTLDALCTTVIDQESGSNHLAFNAVQTNGIANPDADAYTWTPTVDPDALVGQALKAPTQSCMSPPPYESIATYLLRFQTAGTYRFYYRSRNNGTPGNVGSDSFWRATDFNTTPTLYTGIPSTGDYAWTFSSITYTVDPADVGDILEFRIASREGNARICSIVLSTEAGLTTDTLDALCIPSVEHWQNTDAFALDPAEAHAISDPDGDGVVWTIVPDNDALNGRALAAPNTSTTSVPPHESLASFRMRFQQPGTYRLYYRSRNNGTPNDTGSDSFWRPSDLNTDPDVEAATPSTGDYEWTGPEGLYTVTADDIACCTFTVRVTDPGGLYAEAVMRIPVLNSNDAPVFSEDPRTEAPAIIDTPYSASLADWASDPDTEGTVTYSLVSGPAWLSIASDGTASGTPASSDVGLSTFTVCATDDCGAQATAQLNILVQGIFYVRPGGTGDGSTWALADDIQGASGAAVDLAVWVAEGTYTPTGTIYPKTNQTWMGGFPATGTPTAADRDPDAHPTILDGAATLNPIVYLYGDDNVRIDGFIIQNGKRALYVRDSRNATLANCRVRSNTQAAPGVGIYYFGYSSLTIDSCWFSNNYGQSPVGYGAAIFLGSGNSESEPLELNVIDSKFCGNRAEATYFARSAAVLQSAGYYARTRMERCVFAGNHTNYNGAVLGDRYGENEYTFVNCIFSGNVADEAGGINYAAGTRPQTVFLNNTFAHNRSQLEGGALCLRSNDEKVVGNIFASNCGANGSAVDISGAGYLAHNLYYDNTIKTSWGGENSLPEIYVAPGVDPLFESDITGTWTTGPTIADAVASHTVFTDTSASWTPGALVGEVINPNTSQYLHTLIVANTETSLTLVGGGFGAGPASSYCIYNYHLTSASPAIDASDDGSVSGLTPPDTDFDSATRPVDGDGDSNALPDIGAFEAPEATPAPFAAPQPTPAPKPTRTPEPTATPTPAATASPTPVSGVPAPPSTAIPFVPSHFAEGQQWTVTSDGPFYAVLFDAEAEKTVLSADGSGTIDLQFETDPPATLQFYLYDSATGTWAEAVYVYREAAE